MRARHAIHVHAGSVVSTGCCSHGMACHSGNTLARICIAYDRNRVRVRVSVDLFVCVCVCAEQSSCCVVHPRHGPVPAMCRVSLYNREVICVCWWWVACGQLLKGRQAHGEVKHEASCTPRGNAKVVFAA